MQKINFNGNLRKNATMFLIFKEVRKTVLDISQGTVRVLGKISIDFFQFFKNMTQYSSMNANINNSQIDKPKLAAKNASSGTLRPSLRLKLKLYQG